MQIMSLLKVEICASIMYLHVRIYAIEMREKERNINTYVHVHMIMHSTCLRETDYATVV